MNESMPCPYCGKIGYHMWSGAGMCPGLSNPNPPIVVTPVVDDSEMLRAYAETISLKDAEIERLKAQHEEMLLKHAREQSICLSSLDEACKEIERLKTEMDGIGDDRDHWKSAYSECFQAWKALMSRAADALEGWSQNDAVALPLIAELRKAAQ